MRSYRPPTITDADRAFMKRFVDDAVVEGRLTRRDGDAVLARLDRRRKRARTSARPVAC